MSTKTKSTKPKSKSKTKPEPKAEGASSAGIDVSSLQFWLGVVQALLPEEKDEWRQMEIAVVFRLQSGLLAENWDSINKVASANDDRMSVGWVWQSDRTQTPPVVKVNGGYGAKRKKMKAQSDVPDVNQKELPGIDPEPEADDEPPHVTAGVPESND